MTDGSADTEGGYSGEVIILLLYGIVVAIAGTMGSVIGSMGLELQPVSFLGIVTFQPTPLGLAAFGMTVVGFTLGVILVLVVVVSRRYA
ncbi:MAG: cox cluster protein [Natronomonas sp.]